jgi:hypothetical protein
LEIRVLEEDYSSEWASLLPEFENSEKSGTIRVVTNFRDLNVFLSLECHLFSITKNGDIICSMEGFTFASALDLNIGYHHIKRMLMLKSNGKLYSNRITLTHGYRNLS